MVKANKKKSHRNRGPLDFLWTPANLRLGVGLVIGGALFYLGVFIAGAWLSILLMAGAALILSYSFYLYLRGLG